MTSHKPKTHSNLMLLLVAVFVVVAGVYFWRKKAAAKPNCKEICFSTSPDNAEGCDVICVPPATEKAAA